MSRTRYQEILRYLHFVDNNTLTPRDQDGYNKLGKIQPLLNLILPKFQETYCPSRNLSVDETLVKFKGKLSWKQFIKDKPARFGLKLFTLQMLTMDMSFLTKCIQARTMLQLPVALQRGLCWN